MLNSPQAPGNDEILIPTLPGQRSKRRAEIRRSVDPVSTTATLPLKPNNPGQATPNAPSGFSMHVLPEHRRNVFFTTRSGDQIDPHASVRTDSQTTTSLPVNNTIPSRMDLPQMISRQIAEALYHMPARPVEITLSPEEQGRVRLALSSSEAGIVVIVLAERSETIDLMRRHINSLEAAFQAIGYSDISFSFSGGGDAETESRAEQTDTSPSKRLNGAEHADPQASQIRLAPGVTAGLDIRL
ncbi:hypothetical protein GV827_03210 [Sulfitobacter sp. JBTF-M27]|uniref:Flagellar hook-length control protein-like C-terminal domain-containing protein n=2 Tax=Sulfitobacter sediminilitoris TaxID=2698830 RepID=A0A6P0C7M0_9RHOB|nr:flagellar hook-length control protein FliK [Sulfitobacter sediminilitoris]NEK21410.1 hypothetical protein [Sulfitobacter sediminilitoris]